jgi:hypothetical protein
MLIFLNTFVLNKEDRQLISEKCMRDNRVLLWLYAPGLISDKISIDNISSLIQMEIDSEEEREESEIDLRLPDQKLKYKAHKASPFVFIKSGATNVYGYTKDEYSVMAEKKEKDCTNVLACMPPVPWQLIQYYAKKARVHIYSDEGDVVRANQSYLSITAAKPGKRIVKLPVKSSLMELLDSDNDYKTDKRKDLKSGKEHEINFPETGRVKFFQIT